MSEIKALEKMKAVLESCRRTEKQAPPFDTYWITVDACNACIEELEAEIAERFMELPVDADGVPIHMGETVYGKYLEGNPEFSVRGFSFDLEHGQWNVQTSAAMWTSANLLSHVKPRTIEDVLDDFQAETIQIFGKRAAGDIDSEMLRTEYADSIRAHADEIRELMGVRE